MPVRMECRLGLQTTSSRCKLQLECGFRAGAPGAPKQYLGVSVHGEAQKASELWGSMAETLQRELNSALCSGIV